MQFRSLLLSVASIAAITPSLANASTESSALNACAKAFATSLASPGSTAPAFKVAYSTQGSTSLSSFYVREYTFYLKAHNSKTGATVASATCSSDVNGAVALKDTSTGSEQPTLAASLK